MLSIKLLKVRWNVQTTAEKWTWFFWGLVACLIAYKCISHPTSRTVVNNYLDAADLWNNREAIYFGDHGFLYLPQFAFLMSFIAELPRWLLETIERLIQLPLLLGGLYGFSQFLREKSEKSFFPIMSIIAFLVCFSSFRNGQTNIAILGLMLLTVVALTRLQWNRAAVFMTLGLIIKPTFIVFYLVAGALHRSLYWRLAVGVLAAVLIPMLFAGSTYVLDQHLGFINTLVAAVDLGVHKADWASFFGVFPQVFDVFIPYSAQTIVRLILAPVTLLLVWYVRKNSSLETGYYYMYALPACYLMLFNPRNENNDYAILSAALGFWFAVAAYRFHGKALKVFCGVILFGIIGSYELSSLLTPGMDAWVSPVAGTLFTGFLLIRLMKDVRPSVMPQK